MLRIWHPISTGRLWHRCLAVPYAVMAVAVGPISIAWVAGSGVAHAGAVIHQTSRDLPDGKPKDDETVYVQDGMIRSDKLDDRGHPTSVSIFRDGVMWELNVEQRTYKKLDKAAAQQLGAMSAQMQQRLASLPPERRAAIEKAMGSAQAAPPITWAGTGRNEKVAGFACDIWEGKKQATLEYEYCIAQPGAVPHGDEIYAALKQMEASLRDAMSAMQGAAGPAAVHATYDTLSWTERAKGYPILRREFSGGKPYQERAVKSITTEQLPADKFAIPQGFREVSPMGGHGAE
ncbi:MAG: hypothetical protein JO184_17970 [Gammaproteobacteria bacterium]|nr:hypothetical protein [Gammaproteobacteria bacterium]